MPENEFEKQVKELMEQFHISPSAPVWEKIKKRITEKKRRIWPVFFLLVSVLIVSGYFFYADINHSKQNIKTVQQSANNSILKQNTNDNVKKERNNNSEDQTAKSSIKKSNEENPLAIEQHKKHETVFTHQPSSSENNRYNLSNKTNKENPFINKQTSEPNSNNISNNISAQPQNNSSTITTNTEINHQQISDTAANKTSVINAQPAQQDIVNTNVQPDNDYSEIAANNIAEDKTDAETIINKELAKNNQTQNKKASNKKLNNSKWLFGITGMYGSSNITDKITNINIGGNKSLSQVDYLNTPGTPSNNSIHLKNPYSTNNAYNFGVIVQRKISKKSAISTGLNFVHLSSKNTTAISVDSVLIAVVANYQSYSAGSNFYRVGTAKTYTNNFNFIEIPVTFQSNIFKIKNFSLQYDAGFSVMRLLSSKSLIYNSKNNSFFFNDDLLRRTQFQINAGLNFQLHTNAGNFLLGPKLEYSLSTYLKTNDYDKLHFINYGIRASWLFNKK